ncbi:MAG TPA: radical SAM protein [Tichowtungia sp.]|nr:radical SAM protein [Tichowtungia sp.]
MKAKYKTLFGPVPSRRLGRSLGIDVTPEKTCSFDCLFCQCGKTLHRATDRSELVPFDAVCAEMEQWLAEDGQADVITFAGSGEPTLYSRLGELIAFIKQKTDVPVILLTNGTLLHRPDVRDEAAKADIVKISLSAWDDASFQAVNRPAPGISFEQTVQGEQAFRKQFSGGLWLEVFLMAGINDTPEQVKKIAAIAETIRPDKIHLNTAVRPPAETSVRPVAEKTIRSFCDLFTPRAEVIASFRSAPAAGSAAVSGDTLADLIHRHPATAEQLAAICGADAGAVRTALGPLVAAGRLQMEMRDGDRYYK